MIVPVAAKGVSKASPSRPPNKRNNIRMLDTLFIEDFIDSMEQYFHF